jgi:hypothetical protein
MSTQENSVPNVVVEVPYEERYTDDELNYIIEQGLIFMCACPGQVAATVRNLRSTLRYQYNCLNDPVNDIAVHATIARSTIAAHHIMQNCLDSVVALENWDRTTLKMPEGLRKRQLQELQKDA